MDLGRSLTAYLTLHGAELPSDRMVDLFEETIDQVETFTGREFDTVPYLFEGRISEHPEDVDSKVSLDALNEGSVYSAASHAVVMDSNLFDWDELTDRPYAEGMMVEEVSHALQYDQADATGLKSSLSSIVGEPAIPEYSAEGFASYVGTQLTDFGGLEDHEEAISRLNSDVPENLLQELMANHLGMLFFEAHSELYGFDDTVELAMTGMADTDKEYVHDTIKESGIDSELYKKAKIKGLYQEVL